MNINIKNVNENLIKKFFLYLENLIENPVIYQLKDLPKGLRVQYTILANTNYH